MSLDALKSAATNAGNIVYNSSVTTIKNLQNILNKTSGNVNELAKKVVLLVKEFFQNYLPNYLNNSKEYVKTAYDFSKKGIQYGIDFAKKYSSVAITYIRENKKALGIGFAGGVIVSLAVYGISRIFQEEETSI
ncbi:MAG: hypothetical protein WCT85_02495 [Parachlamydiales bacterium]|jgi:hypothetical protein